RDFHVTGVQTCALPISRDSTSRSERLRSRSTTCIASRSICRYKVAGWPASHLSRCVLRRASHRYSSCSTSSALTSPPLLISASRAMLGTVFQTFSEKSQLAVASALLRATYNLRPRLSLAVRVEPIQAGVAGVAKRHIVLGLHAVPHL